MKKRISKEMLIKILTLYQNKISEKFLYTPLTPAAQYQIQAYLDDLQRYYLHYETREEWKVPIKIIFDPYTNTINLDPILNEYEFV